MVLHVKKTFSTSSSFRVDRCYFVSCTIAKNKRKKMNWFIFIQIVLLIVVAINFKWSFILRRIRETSIRSHSNFHLSYLDSIFNSLNFLLFCFLFALILLHLKLSELFIEYFIVAIIKFILKFVCVIFFFVEKFVEKEKQNETKRKFF